MTFSKSFSRKLSDSLMFNLLIPTDKSMIQAPCKQSPLLIILYLLWSFTSLSGMLSAYPNQRAETPSLPTSIQGIGTVVHVRLLVSHIDTNFTNSTEQTDCFLYGLSLIFITCFFLTLMKSISTLHCFKLPKNG